MRTLVTGGAGFIGAHLVAALATAGDEVVVLKDGMVVEVGTHAELRRVCKAITRA